MEAFLPDWLKAILVVIIPVAFSLNWLARKNPEVPWLQAFRLPDLPLTEEQKERRRRTGNQIEGLQIALVGLALPLLYIAATVMMFNDFKAVTTVIVGLCSLSCIALGIWIFWQNRS
jgi:sterol desaturase/sphingolipid hydroxylase (fatty acid hydroxylase superfamily)